MPASSGGGGTITPRPHVQPLDPHVQLPPSNGQVMPTIEHAACLAGGIVGQSAMLQHAHIRLLHSHVRSPYMQLPSPFSHSLASAGSAGGQYCWPQSQPSAVQLQSSRPTVQAIPTVGHAERSAGNAIGQSAPAQQTHDVMPCGQSHI
jgi:hypothetical protein